MTDDISKVVKFLLGEGELRGAWFGDEPPGALGPMPRFWWRKDLRAAFARLESATTPAEVGGVPRRIWSQVLSAPEHMPMRTLLESAGRRALSIHESDQLVNLVATLARQLAEAKADTAKWKSLSDAAQIGINVQHKREVRLQSQLAEATRRLGEVEGLVGKWRECAEDNAARGELIQAGKAVAYTDCADELEAALTKEPTK